MGSISFENYYVTVKEKLQVVDADYRINGNRPVLRLFCIDQEGDKKVAVDRGFRPYFYALSDDLEQLEEDLQENTFEKDDETYEIVKTEEVERKNPIETIEVLKVYGEVPPEIPKLRGQVSKLESVEECREFDIPFYKRYIIDKQISPAEWMEFDVGEDEKYDYEVNSISKVEEETETNFSKLAFDLEVFDDRVEMASFYTEDFRLLLTTADIDRDYVEKVDSEEELIRRFKQVLNERNPDVITGYNTDEFDFQVLRERARSHGMEMDIGVMGEKVKFDRRGRFSSARVKGKMHLDLYPFIAHVLSPGLDSETLDLDSVAEEMLGRNKDEISFEKMKESWNEQKDLEELADYALKDSELAYELAEEIVPQVFELSRITGLIPFDACRLTYGQLTENFLLREAYRRNMLSPNRPFRDERQKRRRQGAYSGGFVYSPEPGIYNDIALLDFKSLYPTVMVSHNISPETLDLEDCDEEFELEEFGYSFCQDFQGFFPELIEGLITERTEIKQKIKEKKEKESKSLESRQRALKILANSFYGYLGYDGARWYSKESAEATTYLGREYIQDAVAKAEEKGFEVVYGDSITEDRCVIVRDPEKRTRIIQVGKLFEKSEKIFSNKKKKAKLNGWEALSVNEEMKSEWKPITNVIRHNTQKDTVRLQHKFGESVTTRDHSYVVEENDELVEKKPSNVKRPLRADFPDVEEIEEVDLNNELKGYKREFIDGRGGGDQRKVNEIYGNEKRIWFGLENNGSSEYKTKLKRYISSEEDLKALVRLTAAYAAEGSASTVETTENKFGASISSSDKEWLEKIEEDYQRLFYNVKTSIIESSNGIREIEYDVSDKAQKISYNDDTLKLQMMNELSAVFFKEIAGQTSKEKRIPWFVFHLSSELQRIFLDVLVEGDGSRKFPRYSREYSEKNFDYETVSRELAAGISILLDQLDIKHSFKYRESKQSYTIRTCEAYRDGREPQLKAIDNDKPVYDLEVEDNHNFVDALGRVVLHNTDSLFIRNDDLENELDSFLEEVNDELPSFMELELEGMFTRGFFTSKDSGEGAKKKYALLSEDGSMKITGFEQVRRDWSPIAKETQKIALRKVLEGDPDQAADIVKETIQNLREREVPVEKLRIYTKLTKKPENYDSTAPHVEAAKKAMERGDEISPGDTIAYVITRGGGSISERAELMKYADDYDADYYIDNQIIPVSMRVLKVFGYSAEQLKGKGKQSGLGEF